MDSIRLRATLRILAGHLTPHSAIALISTCQAFRAASRDDPKFWHALAAGMFGPERAPAIDRWKETRKLVLRWAEASSESRWVRVKEAVNDLCRSVRWEADHNPDQRKVKLALARCGNDVREGVAPNFKPDSPFREALAEALSCAKILRRTFEDESDAEDETTSSASALIVFPDFTWTRLYVEEIRWNHYDPHSCARLETEDDVVVAMDEDDSEVDLDVVTDLLDKLFSNSRFRAKERFNPFEEKLARKPATELGGEVEWHRLLKTGRKGFLQSARALEDALWPEIDAVDYWE